MIQEILHAIGKDRIRISNHARDEAREDRLSIDDILFSVGRGEIIEDYPKDKPFPSCLILGFTDGGRPVHSVWDYSAGTGKAFLITVYEPDPNRWIDNRQRKKI